MLHHLGRRDWRVLLPKDASASNLLIVQDLGNIDVTTLRYRPDLASPLTTQTSLPVRVEAPEQQVDDKRKAMH
jgi:hypothetical protein